VNLAANGERNVEHEPGTRNLARLRAKRDSAVAPTPSRLGGNVEQKDRKVWKRHSTQ